MRNLSGALGGNSCAQLTMNSSASSSRSFSMNGEGSIELKSWFTSRSFRLMVCGCPLSVAAVKKRMRKLLLSSVLPNIESVRQRRGFQLGLAHAPHPTHNPHDLLEEKQPG